MDFPPEATKALPGAAGSLTALIFMKGDILRRLAMGLAGAFAAWYGAGFLAAASHMDEGLAGYLIGLVSMALMEKLFELIAKVNVQGVDIVGFINRWLSNKPTSSDEPKKGE